MASASKPVSSNPVDILAIAAHRDDVEQTCGGTLLAMHARGWRTGILDLTQGESGTRGTADRAPRRSRAAARILNVGHREALDLPDGNVENTQPNRLKIAAVLRRLRPRVVILPYWQGRHPDHYTTATLGYEACFASGLAKLDIPGAPHRPYKILYASLYADVRPSFVVDITPHIEQRLKSLLAYRSQYARSVNRRHALRPRRRHPRAHLLHRTSLRPARRSPLRRALRPEGSGACR